MTQLWIEHLEKEQNVKAIAITTENINEVNQIMDLCRKPGPHHEEVGAKLQDPRSWVFQTLVNQPLNQCTRWPYW